MAAAPASTTEPAIDVWTVGAIAVLAFALADSIHEAGGHGGACLVVRCTPTALNSSYFNYDESGVSSAARRFIEAAGLGANVVAGGLLLAISRRLPPRARYFAWLLATVNLITGFGYLLYSGLVGVGDWAAILDGLSHPWAWRAAEIAAGAALYFVVAPRLTWPGIAPFIGAGDERARRARRLTLVPYFAGAVTLVAAGLGNPLGWRIVLISAVAASFGGASLLAWHYTPRAAQLPLGAPATLGVARSRAWIAAGAIGLALFVGILGRGFRF